MSDQNDQTCTCADDGYSPHCPFAFFQGGQMLHEVKGDGRLKKRYEIIEHAPGNTMKLITNRTKVPDNEDESDDGGFNHVGENSSKLVQIEREEKCQPRLFGQVTAMNHLYGDIEKKLGGPVRGPTIQDERLGQSNLMNADELMAQNRDVLRKYEPLKVGDNVLTDLSIGGFTVDLSKAAQKASEVVPLPPAKLPRIFIDQEMNFSHHFFQGLERLIGRDQLLEIVSKTKYYRNEPLILIPLIEDIIKVGYEKKDTNLTVFTKSVLSSTFELDSRTASDSPERGLLVAANLWGFQYIEAGMECKEPNLKMWLKICYDKFRNIFFNTFKDSGMPDFAMEGVQTRYEPVQKYPQIGQRSASDLNEYRQSNMRILAEDEDDIVSVRSSGRRRRTTRKRNEQTIGAMLFGARH